ncbi:uncharacterized protein L969DRAFT_83419 [Mixia osmundae IAM 14324]|uniref:DNA replication factor Cdt1 C-terminal domain-containing protein n=1 Tax=Mixia osmundae (strain CBS 9802 / IAM 14324 / JCM 22182 / KY 12970) TaxID=764103 RepID=G7E1T6_MIXOS|nr:uncharacterized protein L969DRAFT_83419 [Mixia osmundae IAM 14324]KEI36744.1 hypothetical protein L969DRAFT_83419 [Mixia osmundae IAM 14324]GAA96796.1 hypothetical protein E5Q_03467 [Mixia osmundae IAM 14324]
MAGKGSRKRKASPGELPTAYANLLSTHASLERAMMVHLAKDGARAAATAMASPTPPPLIDFSNPTSSLQSSPLARTRTPSGSSIIRLPNLIAFNDLRPLVENGTGRRFSESELSQLVWLWQLAQRGVDVTSQIAFDSSCSDQSDDEVDLLSSPLTQGRRTPAPTLSSPSARLLSSPNILASPTQQRTSPGSMPSSPDLFNSTPFERRQRQRQISESLQSRSTSTGGMGFLVTVMRKLDRQTGRRVATWGLGIELNVKRNVQVAEFELLQDAAPLSSSDDEQDVQQARAESASGRPRDGMSVIALWSQGAAARKDLISRRLRHWAKPYIPHARHEEAQDVTLLDSDLSNPSTPRKRKITDIALPTPPDSRKRSRLVPPEIPRARLPDLPAAVPVSANTRLTRDDTDDTPIGRLKGGINLMTGDPLPVSPPSSPTKGGNVETRKMSLFERIKAKEAAQNVRSNGQAVSLASPTMRKSLQAAPSSSAMQSAALRRRSMLSRLADVADQIYMLFNAGGHAPASPSSSNPTPPTRRRRAIPFCEVAKVVSQSSKISVSTFEANDALQALCALCPTFVEQRKIDGQSWLVMVSPTNEIEPMTLKEVKERIAITLAA